MIDAAHCLHVRGSIRIAGANHFLPMPLAVVSCVDRDLGFVAGHCEGGIHLQDFGWDFVASVQLAKAGKATEDNLPGHPHLRLPEIDRRRLRPRGSRFRGETDEGSKGQSQAKG